MKTLARHLDRFKNATRFVWCQEEPQNMGPWNFIENYIEAFFRIYRSEI